MNAIKSWLFNFGSVKGAFLTFLLAYQSIFFLGMDRRALCHTFFFFFKPFALGSCAFKLCWQNVLPSALTFPWTVRLSCSLTLVSLLRQLHLSIGRGPLYFSYLCLIFGEVDAGGESSSVKRK